jgi:hypothetical protein
MVPRKWDRPLHLKLYAERPCGERLCGGPRGGAIFSRRARKIGLDAKSQMPYSRPLTNASNAARKGRRKHPTEKPNNPRGWACTWEGRDDALPAGREALGRLHGCKRLASDTPNALPRRTAPGPLAGAGGAATVQSLPEKYRVLCPPGTQPFRGLFLRAGAGWRGAEGGKKPRMNADRHGCGLFKRITLPICVTLRVSAVVLLGPAASPIPRPVRVLTETAGNRQYCCIAGGTAVQGISPASPANQQRLHHQRVR